MSPEELFDLVEPQRAGGSMKALSAKRCRERRCHMIGTYDLRGTAVTIITDLKLSPGKSEELGLPRVVPGRAWLGRSAPAGEWYGCAHHLDQTN